MKKHVLRSKRNQQPSTRKENGSTSDNDLHERHASAHEEPDSRDQEGHYSVASRTEVPSAEYSSEPTVSEEMRSLPDINDSGASGTADADPRSNDGEEEIRVVEAETTKSTRVDTAEHETRQATKTFLPPLSQDPYSGEYRALAQIFDRGASITFIILVITLAATYSLIQWAPQWFASTAFCAVFLILATFVVSPSPILLQRYPVNALVTFALAWVLAPFGVSPIQEHGLGWIAGGSFLLLLLYWLAVYAIWAFKVYRNEARSGASRAPVAGTLLALGGFGLQLVLFSGQIVLPAFETRGLSSPITRMLAGTTDFSNAVANIRAMAGSLIALGFTVIAYLRFKSNPPDQVRMQDVPPQPGTGFLRNVGIALKPVTFVLVVLAKRVHHLVEIAIDTVSDFLRLWGLRLVFLCGALLLGPLLLFSGHWLVFSGFRHLSNYLDHQPDSIYWGVHSFLIVHFLIGAGVMVIYPIAIAIFALPFRGQTARQFIVQMKSDLPSQSQPAFEAVCNAYATILLLVLSAIPIVAAFPGPPTLGLYSIGYLSIILLALSYRAIRNAL